MTLRKFHSLNEKEKYYTLKHQGVELTCKPFEKYAVYLFQIDDFYIELKYNYENKKIDQMNAFDNLKESFLEDFQF